MEEREFQKHRYTDCLQYFSFFSPSPYSYFHVLSFVALPISEKLNYKVREILNDEITVQELGENREGGNQSLYCLKRETRTTLQCPTWSERRGGLL